MLSASVPSLGFKQFRDILTEIYSYSETLNLGTLTTVLGTSSSLLYSQYYYLSEQGRVRLYPNIPKRIQRSEDHLCVLGNSVIRESKPQKWDRCQQDTHQIPVKQLNPILLGHIEASVISSSCELRQVCLDSQSPRQS